MADVPAWHARGEWFDLCRCNVPCPCSWAQAPDDDYCDAVLVWHIREGRYGDVALDGLNVVAFASFKGNIWEGAHSEPKMGVVMDERDEGQREALQMIFGGQAGGWPTKFNEIFGPEMLGLEFAPIEVEIAPDQTSWSAVIPGLVRAAARGDDVDGPPRSPARRAWMASHLGWRTFPGPRRAPGKSALRARQRRIMSAPSATSGTAPETPASTSPSTGAVPTRHDRLG